MLDEEETVLDTDEEAEEAEDANGTDNKLIIVTGHWACAVEVEAFIVLNCFFEINEI